MPGAGSLHLFRHLEHAALVAGKDVGALFGRRKRSQWNNLSEIKKQAHACTPAKAKSDARCVAGQALCVDHAIRPIQPDVTAHYNQLSHEIKSLTPHDDVMDLFERSESRS
eukprot:CAMPEP_0179454064 /NCGR_PEP_ID=MMETSP0799-20121207/37931_1 /TAXON_ID=46947 /ORGANISM="Geminigera cryophila, Strain CCMP2564" /LENGTH=110 /DNA_ID=CAMNT_0021251575 /DNA_START=242 /DNA_END=574 /DNA_ORIENTATION=+